jgi:DNA (cytosine-5)-methyltransferase 1
VRPRLLDIFCGAGGAAMGYHRAGFEVIGVDINPQPNYPFEFIQDDALAVLRGLTPYGWKNVSEVAAIHASPPCQAYSNASQHHKDKHPALIEPVRELLQKTGLPYVIENVEGAPLNYPFRLCGSMFNLRVRRHRLFETNWDINHYKFCSHTWQDDNPIFITYDHGKWVKTGVAPVYGSGGRKAVEYWPMAMGVGTTWDDCWMTRDELKEAIPPAYTEFIGKQLLAWLSEGAGGRVSSTRAKDEKTRSTTPSESQTQSMEGRF